MADEKQAQEPEQEQEQVQEPVPVQGEEPAETPQGEPVKEKQEGDGLLMPILYALLAAVGTFTLVMIIGIVVTFLTRPAQPSNSPSEEQSAQVTQTRSYQSPDMEVLDWDTAV